MIQTIPSDPSSTPVVATGVVPPLLDGQRLDQPTFHARYEAMPEHVRAELIEGIVVMSSPEARRHNKTQGRLSQWLFAYEDATPGVEAFGSVTTILGPGSEPQPDGCLLISPAAHGQTGTQDDYITGAPELMAEISFSTERIDLQGKKRDYEKAGVKEYLVAALRQGRVYWFVRRDGAFAELAPGPDGILRSEVFPGLWLDPAALLRHDAPRVLEVLRQGLATPEHAAWVKQLKASAPQ